MKFKDIPDLRKGDRAYTFGRMIGVALKFDRKAKKHFPAVILANVDAEDLLSAETLIVRLWPGSCAYAYSFDGSEGVIAGGRMTKDGVMQAEIYMAPATNENVTDALLDKLDDLP